MAKLQTELLDLLNGSGFPFQVGVRKEIEQTANTHGWAVDAEEHYWRHPKTECGGFIDFVISHQQYIFTILIECKRVKEDGKWLFLMPRDYTADQRRISALCTQSAGAESKAFLGWCDFDFDPVSPEAAYCVFRGQDEKKPMLERIADDLLPAVEGVGFEDLEINMGDKYASNQWRIFLPLIVTNAILYTSTFDANKVSMASGRLPEDACEFKPVPFVRFRKSLATHYPRVGLHPGRNNSLRKASVAKERTVLVINSAALADCLKLLKVSAGSEYNFGYILKNLNANSQFS